MYYSRRHCQGLILVPTRELALQIQDVIQSIGDHLGVISHACIGGTSVSKDISALRSGVHVIVGTPSRVCDMLRRKVFDSVKHVIFDEADKLLSHSFIEIIREIFSILPSNSQVGVFSAAMTPEIVEFTNEILNDPIKIMVKSEGLTVESIRQFSLNEKEEWKLKTLCDLYNEISINQSVIFCNHKKVDWLAQKMNKRGFTVTSIHSDKPEERKLVMEQFRSGASRVLITTTSLAPDIDVQQVSVVINFDLPNTRENFLHRISQSSRFGRGIAIHFVTVNDVHLLRDLEKYYDATAEEMSGNIADLI